VILAYHGDIKNKIVLSSRIFIAFRSSFIHRTNLLNFSGVMAHEEHIHFRNARRQNLAGIVHHPAADATAAVILCHGMESSKASEKIVTLSRELAQRGILALRFDFAGSGESGGRFEEMTYSGEVEDLRAAYEVVVKYRPEKIGVFGSSMGGTVALLFAAQEESVATVVTLAAPVHPERFTERLSTPEQTQQWRTQGYTLYHGRRIDVSLLNDLERLDVMNAARKITCPVLVIHGDKDDTVPVEEAHELYAALQGPKKLCILPGSNHRLTNPEHLQKALAESIEWLTGHLQ
jgi:dipeptidyl aminopeptidase/acylaminoacyl peptidase